MIDKSQLTVFVGDIDKSVALKAKAHDSTAFLVDITNYKTIINREVAYPTTIYTSLGDLRTQNLLIEVCRCAGRVVYAPPDHWSDQKTVNELAVYNSIQGLTEYALAIVKQYQPVDNFNLTYSQSARPLVDQRKCKKPQLWIAGCSISHGVGITPDQRYGQLVADKLNTEVSFLTRGGSSIAWAADQILRSDILPNDTVVFGITNLARLPYVKDQKLLPGVTIKTYDQIKDLDKHLPKQQLFSENTFYQHIIAIEQALNFCKKIQAKIILFGLLANTSPELLRKITGYSEFIGFPYKLKQLTVSEKLSLHPQHFIDYGSDKTHPGPVQHQQFAKFLLNHLS